MSISMVGVGSMSFGVTRNIDRSSCLFQTPSLPVFAVQCSELGSCKHPRAPSTYFGAQSIQTLHVLGLLWSPKEDSGPMQSPFRTRFSLHGAQVCASVWRRGWDNRGCGGGG